MRRERTRGITYGGLAGFDLVKRKRKLTFTGKYILRPKVGNVL